MRTLPLLVALLAACDGPDTCEPSGETVVVEEQRHDNDSSVDVLSTSTFDAEGRLLRSVVEDFTTPPYTQREVTTNTYDEDGLLLNHLEESCATYEEEDLGCAPPLSTDYLYDGGRLVRTETSQGNSVPTCVDYAYEGALLVRELRSTGCDDSVSSEVRYDHDGAGRVTRQVEESFSGGRVQERYTTTFYYDDDGYLASDTRRGTTNRVEQSNTYSYDPSGHLVGQVFNQYSDNELIMTETTYRSCSPAGELLSLQTYTDLGPDQVLDRLRDCTYTYADGALIHSDCSFQWSHNGDGVIDETELSISDFSSSDVCL